MAAELPQPGVQVIQVFTATTPTIIVPTLVPVVVGVCRQIVEVLTTTAAGGTVPNTSALVPLQASFTALAAVGTPPVYAGLDGLHLDVSLGNGPPVVITFAGTSLSPAQVVALVQAAFSTALVAAYTAEVVGTTSWRMRSLAANEFQTIQILSTSSPAVLAAFGLGAGREYVGSSFYTQDITEVGITSFPDPRANLSQLVIDPTTVRAFFFMGGTGSPFKEILPNQSFLRGGLAQPATTVGSVLFSSLTYGGGGSLDTQALLFKVNGGSTLTVTFAAPADEAHVLLQINAVLGAAGLATDSTGHLKLSTAALGPAATLQILASAAATTLGLTLATTVGITAVAAIDDGNGDAVTPLLSFPGQDFTAVAASAVITGTVSIAGGVTNGQTLILDDGTGAQTLIFEGASTDVLVLLQINALFGTAAGGSTHATQTGGHLLILTNPLTGDDSQLTVLGGTALTALGLTAETVRGLPFPPKPGDAIYVDGVQFAVITQVAPGGNVAQVKINQQVPISASLGLSFYMEALGIPLPVSGRPTPDLTVDGYGNLTIKSDILRDTRGLPSTTARAQIYIQYHAIRQDVSPLATNPGLLTFSSTTDVTSQLAPVSADNPLALGAYFACLNAPGIQVTGVGVDEATPADPFGTPDGFARAATFLEGFEVYAIAPLTHDNTVGQIFNTHVTFMSAPENKGERIVLFNPSVPTTFLDTLVASGTNGQTNSFSNQFNTNIANIAALLLAQGINPVGPLSVSAGVYLDIGDGKKYSVININDEVVTVKTSGFLAGENDDGYYAITTLTTPLIDEVFALRIRGAALVLSNGLPDLNNIALTVQKSGMAIQNRRYWQTFPDKCAALLGGVEQVIDGFYLNAAAAGMIGAQPPQQSFTNFPMTGFTRVIGLHFSNSQLNVMAAGGNYIFTQEGDGAPLIARMALTTDMTSIETRTDSITKVVDFTSKFMRTGLRNFIGRFNITQGFLDSLGHVQQGLGAFLVEAGVLIGYNLNNIIQDEAEPDSVLTDSTLDVPFPCNYLRVTLAI